jgi:hypothetical protein
MEQAARYTARQQPSAVSSSGTLHRQILPPEGIFTPEKLAQRGSADKCLHLCYRYYNNFAEM